MRKVGNLFVWLFVGICEYAVVMADYTDGLLFPSLSSPHKAHCTFLSLSLYF